jgi:AAA+ ATPase superfamily predicted ATPase
MVDKMKKPADIRDRNPEWEELIRIWRRASPELVFILGRRRVGKSFLLARFARAVGGLYYQATKRTENEQLARLSTLVGEHFDDPALRHGGPFPDWEGLFRYVAQRAGDRPFLVVLDEFPYLSAAAPALPSILQSLWDHEWPETGLKLVLSGSHITAMKRLEDADQPLYGRRTARLDIEPFDYIHAAEFLPGYPATDRLRAYGIFGGVPGHLALLAAAESLGENVALQMLCPTGRLLDEAQHMLDAFLTDARVHYSVIEAIAGGERTWNGITKRVGRDGGSLSRAMKWLIEMGIVERVVPITETNPQKSKRALYRITDPYVAFWHRFVSPMVSAGMIGLAPGDRLWTEQVLPRLDDYMGGAFESVCRDFVRRGTGLPFRPLRVGEWWDAGSQNEVDVVALGADAQVLVGECKWGDVRGSDLARLRTRANLLVQDLTGGPHQVHFAVFSGGSVDPSVLLEVQDGRLLHFSADALYEGRSRRV